MQRLTAADASFLYVESAGGPTHISSVFALEGELSYESVLAHFEHRIHLVPAYRRKLSQVPLSIAHPTWVDDADFDLTNHVHRARSEGPTHQEAVDTAIRLTEPLLDRGIPLWHLWVIDGVPGRTYIAQATHHAMIDGASGVELMTILFDLDPEGREVPPPEKAWTPEPTPGPAEQFSRALADNAAELAAMDWSKLVPSEGEQRRLTERAGRIMSDFFTHPVITAPFNAGMVGPKRRLRSAVVPYAEMREVRRALGGTINDVALTAVSEGVSRYLESKGERTKNQHMRIMCPVNVRTENEQGALGNRVSGVFPVLPAWPMAPAERLTVVRAEMERIKDDQDAQALALAQNNAPPIWPVAMLPNQLVGTPFDPTRLAAAMPVPPTASPAMRPPNIGVNFVCTNVPGVQVPMYMCGHEVVEQYPVLCLLGNLGFGVAILSYNQHLYFGFISETRLLPDVELIAEATRGAFDELLEIARAA